MSSNSGVDELRAAAMVVDKLKKYVGKLVVATNQLTVHHMIIVRKYAIMKKNLTMRRDHIDCVHKGMHKLRLQNTALKVALGLAKQAMPRDDAATSLARSSSSSSSAMPRDDAATPVGRTMTRSMSSTPPSTVLYAENRRLHRLASDV